MTGKLGFEHILLSLGTWALWINSMLWKKDFSIQQRTYPYYWSKTGVTIELYQMFPYEEMLLWLFDKL